MAKMCKRFSVSPLLHLLFSPYECHKTNKLSYLYSIADYSSLHELPLLIPWYIVLLEDDIDSNWTVWCDLLFTTIEECVPKGQIKTRKRAPWITCDLIKSCKKKRKLHSIKLLFILLFKSINQWTHNNNNIIYSFYYSK